MYSPHDVSTVCDIVYMQPAIERKKPQTTKTKHTFFTLNTTTSTFMYHLIENI